MKTEIDFDKIRGFIEANKTKKPPFVAVDDEEWSDALDGYASSFFSALTEDEMRSTEEMWSLIYFCAIAFCRGVERESVRSGRMQETYYPRY